MATFDNTYSLPELITIVASLAVATVSTWKGIEWVSTRLKKIFSKEYKTKNKELQLEARLVAIEKRQQDTDASILDIMDSLKFFAEKLEILVDSDKDSIKAYLTDKHHYYIYTQKWIDDYNLDCIERRYDHYKKAGGNSFVDQMMEDLRKLQRIPPQG